MQADDTKIKNLTINMTASTEPVKKVMIEKEKNVTYSYEEAYQSTLEYFNGDELAATVWVNKYALKDSFGKIYEKNPEQMHWRIANEIYRIEQKYPNPTPLIVIHS